MCYPALIATTLAVYAILVGAPRRRPLATAANAGQWASPIPQQPKLDAWVHKTVENKQLDVVFLGKRTIPRQ